MHGEQSKANKFGQCAIQTATWNKWLHSDVAVADAQWMMGTVLPFGQEDRKQGAGKQHTGINHMVAAPTLSIQPDIV
jgi:hypothetical protein